MTTAGLPSTPPVPKISTVVPSGTIQLRALARKGSARGFQQKPDRDTCDLDSVEESVVVRCAGVWGDSIEIHRDTVASYCHDVARRRQQAITGIPEIERIKADISDARQRYHDKLRQIALIREQAPDETLAGSLERVVAEETLADEYYGDDSVRTDGAKRGPFGQKPIRQMLAGAGRFFVTFLKGKAPWGYLIAFLVVETIINGWFFSEQMIDPPIEAYREAVLISVVNIFGLALLAATAIMLWKQNGLWSRIFAGALGFVAVPATLLFHLGVAHFRDALPPIYPPSPLAPSIEDLGELATTTADVLACFRGGQFDAASAEALCLLARNPIGLFGIKSWFFLMLGIKLWSLAVWKWGGILRRRRSSVTIDFDVIDGEDGESVRATGPTKRKKRKEMVSLASQRVLEDARTRIMTLRHRALDMLRWNPGDLMARCEGIQMQRASLVELSRNLEKECEKGIAMYRKANRETRGDYPPPEHWGEPWRPRWDLPSDLDEDTTVFPDSSALNEILEAERNANAKRLGEFQGFVEESLGLISRLHAEFDATMRAHLGRDLRKVVITRTTDEGSRVWREGDVG